MEVCASLLQGQLERNAEVVLSTQDGKATGLLNSIISSVKMKNYPALNYLRIKFGCNILSHETNFCSKMLS